MKNIILIILAVTALSCEKRLVRPNNEFYNQSLDEKINGYEIWQTEAQEFSKSSRWAQTITEPLIGYFDIIYFKYEKANSSIRVKLNYIFDVKKAYSELQTDAIKNNYSMNQGEVRAGFYVLSFGSGGSTKVFQTWTIPADSIISNHKKGIANLTLGYKDYSSTTSDFKDSNGNTILVINLNNISNATTILPEYEIAVFSNYGKVGSNTQVRKSMLLERKVKDF